MVILYRHMWCGRCTGRCYVDVEQVYLMLMLYRYVSCGHYADKPDVDAVLK